MTTTPKEREPKVKVTVDVDPVPTSFEKWAKPGHFDRSLLRGPKTSMLLPTTLTVILLI